MHLIIDGVCKNKKLLTDKEELRKWLTDTVAAIGMSVVDGPYVVEFEVPDGEYKGLTGIVILAESHVSVHTFPELGYAFIDVFSCFPFDAEGTSKLIRGCFAMERIRKELAIDRGITKSIDRM